MSKESDGPTPPVIINACLSFIRYSMLTKDKLYIKNATCSKFDLVALKSAHEAITNHCKGGKKFKGPNGATHVEKCAACFDDIFRILSNLDAQSLSPSIACPCEELEKLLTVSESPEQKLIEDRLQQLEYSCKSINTSERLSNIEMTVTDLKKTVLAMMTAPLRSGRDLLPSQGEKENNVFTPDATAFPSLPRERSDSVKRMRSEDADQEGEFDLPREQRRKLDKRCKLSNTGGTTTLAKIVANGEPKKTNNKTFKWGQSSDVDIQGFSGRVPDVFISRCSLATEADVIKTHLFYLQTHTSLV